MLHYVRIKTKIPNAFGVVCDRTFMFDRDSCLQDWLATYEGSPGEVPSPKDFLRNILTEKRNSEGS